MSTGVRQTQYSTRYGQLMGSLGVVNNGGTTGVGGGDVTGSLGGILNVVGIGGIPVDVTSPTDTYVISYDAGSGTFVLAASAGGVPSATVTDETTFGIVPDAGVSTDYSRGDHTHGSPDLPDIETLATAATDTTLVLAPDGIGGVEFRTETGGGGGISGIVMEPGFSSPPVPVWNVDGTDYVYL